MTDNTATALDGRVSAAGGGDFGRAHGARNTHSPQGSVDIDSPALSQEVMAEGLARRRNKDGSF